jgi:adenylylsulfate kinase
LNVESQDPLQEEIMTETRTRSLVKAISYRVMSSLVTGTILFGLTQKGWWSIGVALFDSLVKTSIFYLHERTWTMIGFARVHVHSTSIKAQRLPGSALRKGLSDL